MNILLIEDNQDLACNVMEYLEAQGHVMDAAADGITGMHLAVVNDYDVIVLDLTLPGMDGLDLCRKLRAEAGKATPVLMLTARDTLEDKLAGFDSGADDYLVKPFALKELYARLLSLSRRSGLSATVSDNGLQVVDLEMDLGTLQVRRAGNLVSLTPIGRQLLECLMRESPRVVTRSRLEQVVWGDIPPDSDALKAHMHSLRNAIDKPFDKHLLQTVRGAGYRLADPDEISS
ncbi:MAG TPA: response regulator transcription factor [Gammaproteobacteria bacterium]|nr:response regulator transcription factor [Gammaproteobacteria bacterium]